MLPDFLIIGGMKCGTTSLFHYLDMHSKVCTSETKEPAYFTHNKGKPLSWYESKFPNQKKCVAGEASTHYTKHPIHKGVPEQIHSALPSVKLIYLVRDPIRRLVSHYIHNKARGLEDRPIDKCLSLDVTNPYVSYGRYAYQIRKYLSYFNMSEILIMESEGLRGNREEEIRRVLSFIGVEYEHHKEYSEEKNTSEEAAKRGWIAQKLSEVDFLHGIYASIPPYVREKVRPVYRSSVERPSLSQVQRTRLMEVYRSEVQWLRRNTDQSFSNWSV